jgi:hypothetical protein
MNDIKFYRATLNSDSGKHYIWLSATDEDAAKRILQATQCCPERAITKLVEKTKKQFHNRMNLQG